MCVPVHALLLWMLYDKPFLGTLHFNEEKNQKLLNFLLRILWSIASSHRSAWSSCYHPHLNAFQRITRTLANHKHYNTGFKSINILWKEELDLFPVQWTALVAHMRAPRTTHIPTYPPSQDTYQNRKRNTAHHLYTYSHIASGFKNLVFWSVCDWYSHRERGILLLTAMTDPRTTAHRNARARRRRINIFFLQRCCYCLRCCVAVNILCCADSFLHNTPCSVQLKINYTVERSSGCCVALFSASEVCMRILPFFFCVCRQVHMRDDGVVLCRLA